MTPAKRVRAGAETSLAEVTSFNHASANQISTTTVPTFILQLLAPTQTNIPQPTLQGMSFEAFLHITDYLAARDIINLSQGARSFRHILASTARLNMARLGKTYDKKTRTLNLTRQFTARQTSKTYQHYLSQVEIELTHHTRWPQTHIKTLVLPLEALYQWKLHGKLNTLLPHLTGVTHVCLIQGITDIRCRGTKKLTSSSQRRLWDNLAAFKDIPCKKLALNNSAAVKYLSQSIWEALNKKLLNSALEALVFTDERGDIPAEYQLAINNDIGYSHLTTLDFSSSPYSAIALDSLPDTVSCLRINGITRITGHTRKIKRLEILSGNEDDLYALETLRTGLIASPQFMPELEEIYIDQPLHPEQHRKMLILLAGLPEKNLSIILESLYVSEPAVLDRAMLKNTVYLPQNITFYPQTSQDILHFTQMVQQNVFGELITLRYQITSLTVKALSSLFKILPAALQNLTFQYQKTDFINHPFLESEDGKLLLALSKEKFTLNQILPPKGMVSLLSHFVSSVRKIQAGKKISATLIQRLENILLTHEWQLSAKKLTYRQWLAFLQQIHMKLAHTCQHYLAERIHAPPIYQEIRRSFLATEVGVQLSEHICERLFRILAERIRKRQDKQMPITFGFNTRCVVQSNAQGFELSWRKQHAQTY